MEARGIAHQAFDEPVSCVKLSYQRGVPERTEDLLGFVTDTLGDLQAHSRALSGPDRETREYWNAVNALELLDVWLFRDLCGWAGFRAHLFTLFALSNLFLVRRRLMA